MGHLLGQADGQQHMAGVQRTGGAGGAGGGADARQIQPQQQALALDALKAYVHIAGQPVLHGAVHPGAGDVRDARQQRVPQGGDVGHVLLQVLRGLPQRRGHAQNAGQILRAGPPVALLSAALQQGGQAQTAAAVERAHALGPVELVAAQGQQVHPQLVHVHGDVAHRLHRVGVDGHLVGVTKLRQRPNGLNRADFVVRQHDADQRGVVTQRGLQLLRPDQPVLVHVQIGDLKAVLLQPRHGVQHRVVLEGGGDEVLFAPGRALTRQLPDGPVVRLRAAGGEVNLPRLRAQAPGHALPGLLQRRAGALPQLVEAGGVAVVLPQRREHRRQSRLADAGGGRVVHINCHDFHAFFGIFPCFGGVLCG